MRRNSVGSVAVSCAAPQGGKVRNPQSPGLLFATTQVHALQINSHPRSRPLRSANGLSGQVQPFCPAATVRELSGRLLAVTHLRRSRVFLLPAKIPFLFSLFAGWKFPVPDRKPAGSSVEEET